MNIFDIDFKRLIVQLLPISLRLQEIFAVFLCAVKPVITLYGVFQANRMSNIYQVTHTGQICYLRGMLNDIFDPTQRRIYIGTGQPASWLYAWKTAMWTAQGNPIWIKPADTSTVLPKTYYFNANNTGVVLVAKQGNVSAAGYDFTVNIPSELQSSIDERKVIAFLNFYKLVSKRYIINYNE